MRPNGIRKACQSHKKIVSFKVSAKQNPASRSGRTLRVSTLVHSLRKLWRKQRKEKKKNSNSNLAATGQDSTYDTCMSEVSSNSTTASVIHNKSACLGFTNPSSPCTYPEPILPKASFKSKHCFKSPIIAIPERELYF